MKRTAHKEKSERHQLNYRVSKEQYEYIARLKSILPKGTIQRVLDTRIFPVTWREELEELRRAQRKLGRRDLEFVYPKVLRDKGYVVTPGPAHKRKLRRAA